VLGLDFVLGLGLRSCNIDIMLIQVYHRCHWTNPCNWILLMAK